MFSFQLLESIEKDWTFYYWVQNAMQTRAITKTCMTMYCMLNAHIVVGVPTCFDFQSKKNQYTVNIFTMRQKNRCLCAKQEVWVESRRNQLGNEISSTHICHYTKWLKSSIIGVTKQSVAHSKQASLIGEAAQRRDRPFSSSSFFDIRYPCPPSLVQNWWVK